VRVTGDLLAGDGDSSGAISAFYGIASVMVEGLVTGDINSPAGTIASIQIGGSLSGSAERPARIFGESIGKVSIGGAMVSALIRSAQTIGEIRVGEAVQDSRIVAVGTLLPKEQAGSQAIGTVTVGGDFERSLIHAGYADDAFPWLNRNPDAGIGSVVIGGDFLQSSIAGGVDSVDGHFGNDDDRLFGNGGAPAILARIASVTIGGRVLGTEDSGDTFGIVAEQIDSIRIGGAFLPLTSATDALTVGATGDVTVREETRTAQG
jgi:hypothetical protein